MYEETVGSLTELTGWGGTSPSVARYTEPSLEALPAVLARAGARGLIPRGLARSYGDAAQNAGGDVVGPLPARIELDRDAAGGATVRVSAGTSLHQLMVTLIPTGHFVPVTPGTRYVTVGGAIAADVHGKNHHRDGSLGSHLVSLDLMLADGEVRTIGPDLGADLFWATVGGMGLTGFITSAVLRVPRIDSGWMRVRTERIDDLATLMRRMSEADTEATHSVAWIDTLARGRALGRAVLTLGEHARKDELGGRPRWVTPNAPAVSTPSYLPGSPVSRAAVRAFNELWFRKAPRLREAEIQSISAFFHPLDLVRGWNRLYGRQGFVQYQLVLPDAAQEELPRVLERVATAGHPSFLSVLKRFGPGNQGLLSFPTRGWTLAIDVPTDPGLRQLFAELDRFVADRGGRIYLAKDSRMSAEMFAATYPRLDAFRQVKASVDPHGVFQSDLSRRLRI